MGLRLIRPDLLPLPFQKQAVDCLLARKNVPRVMLRM